MSSLCLFPLLALREVLCGLIDWPCRRRTIFSPKLKGLASVFSKTRLTGTLRGLRPGLHSSLRVPPTVAAKIA